MKKTTTATLAKTLVLSSLLFAVEVVLAQDQQDFMLGTCPYLREENPLVPRNFFRSSYPTCDTCPINTHHDSTSQSCVCDAGLGYEVWAGNGTLKCQNCTDLGQVLSVVTGGCTPCGNSQWLYNETVIGNFTLAPPLFDNATGSCSCPTTSTTMTSHLVETIGDLELGFTACLHCTSADASCGHPCPSPKAWDWTTQTCVCSAGLGYTSLADGTCAKTSLYASLVPVEMNSLGVAMLNLDNSGGPARFTLSWIQAKYLPSASYWCAQGDTTKCNLLANLCVLNQYDQTTPSCLMYREIQLRESCRGLACEIPTSLPWLYYLRASPLVLQEDLVVNKISLEKKAGHIHKLEFVLSEYALNGTWLGNTLVTNQLQVCEEPAAVSQSYFDVGANRRKYCHLNLRHFLQAPETTFYELWYKDGATVGTNAQMTEPTTGMIPVPVLLDYGKNDITPKSVNDASIFREGSAPDGSPLQGGYKRRFYLHDNIGASPSESGTAPTYVSFVRRASLLISLQPNHQSKIFPPLLVLQYACTNTESYPLVSDMEHNELKRLKTNRTPGPGVMTGSAEVRYAMSASDLEQGLMITLTTLTILIFFSACIRTYYWQRRQQLIALDMSALVRWFFYVCNHMSNVYCLIVVIGSGYLYIFYKHQSAVEVLLPDGSPYLFAMLYTAVSCKIVYVFYKLFEQCKINWFVVDWEKSRGTLLRENKDVEVTMWRSTFVANELNELQIYRLWNPMWCIVIIMVFLEGWRYMDLALTVPVADVDGASREGAYYHPILRIAVASFYWVVIPLVFYVLQHGIYYRFLSVHPLRGFVDLCSVSNISVIMLLEPNFGFYIHGKSIHEHADAGMKEFQENLSKEAKGVLPPRGLGKNVDCQVFEIYVGWELREQILKAHWYLMEENGKAMAGAATDGKPQPAGKNRSVFEVLSGSPGQVVAFTEETLGIKSRLNSRFIESVEQADQFIQKKDPLHNLLDLTPNILYMNGMFQGQKRNNDFYYEDSFDSWSRCLLAGLDLDIFVMYLLLFCTIDSNLENTFVSMGIIYVIDMFIVWFRETQGEANLGAKTMFDERFFV